MKPASACVSMCLVAVLIAAQLNAQPKDVDGWQNIKWGMSVAEARAALGSQASEPTEESGPNVVLIKRLLIENITIGDFLCKAALQTKRGSDAISAVTISLPSMRDPPDHRGHVFDSLKRSLIEKYGQPKSEDRRAEGGDVESIILWTFPSTSITLRRVEGSRGFGYVNIEYRAVDKKAIDAL